MQCSCRDSPGLTDGFSWDSLLGRGLPLEWRVLSHAPSMNRHRSLRKEKNREKVRTKIALKAGDVREKVVMVRLDDISGFVRRQMITESKYSAMERPWLLAYISKRARYPPTSVMLEENLSRRWAGNHGSANSNLSWPNCEVRPSPAGSAIGSFPKNCHELREVEKTRLLSELSKNSVRGRRS